MSPSPSILTWIETQHSEMLARVRKWSNINSGTSNPQGIVSVLDQIEPLLRSLDAKTERIELPPERRLHPDAQWREQPVGPLLRAVKRPDAKRRVLLNIHADTVYPLDHPLQKTRLLDDKTLSGPGVADAKGGLAVMLTALEAFERSPDAANLGWEVLINPEEEIGSPSSRQELIAAAARSHVGLLFEPALPDGALVSSRKGSGNFTLLVRGRSAHAGRDLAAGRNALVALAATVTELASWNAAGPGIAVNVAAVHGGGAANVVPDLAFCRFNVRAVAPADMAEAQRRLDGLFHPSRAPDGVSFELHGSFTAPPKVIDARTQTLMAAVAACGKQIGLDVAYRPSGGVSDGNRLAAAGLPVIDTLGPVGDGLHSDREQLSLDSLVPRAKLTAALLADFAAGGWPELF